jgi:hypothetical protein
LREGESELNGNPNENVSTPVSAILPSEFSGTRTLSLRGSGSLLPVSSSVEDPELVTSRLDQEQGIRIGVSFVFFWLRIFDTDTIDVENSMFLVNQT